MTDTLSTIIDNVYIFRLIVSRKKEPTSIVAIQSRPVTVYQAGVKIVDLKSDLDHGFIFLENKDLPIASQTLRLHSRHSLFYTRNDLSFMRTYYSSPRLLKKWGVYMLCTMSRNLYIFPYFPFRRSLACTADVSVWKTSNHTCAHAHAHSLAYAKKRFNTHTVQHTVWTNQETKPRQLDPPIKYTCENKQEHVKTPPVGSCKTVLIPRLNPSWPRANSLQFTHQRTRRRSSIWVTRIWTTFFKILRCI